MSDTTMTIPADPTGLHYDLDEQTYHAHIGSLSSTGAKLIRKAPALFRHEQEHPVVKRVFDYGSAAHKYALGIGPKIVHVQRTMKDGTKVDADDMRAPSTREHADEIRANGDLPMLAKEHAEVQAMAAKITTHELARNLLMKGEPEVSAFAADEATGVMRRGRVDWLRKRVIVDYKTATSADPRALRRVALDHGWYQQAPWYVDLLRDLGRDIDSMYFICQEKKAPYLVSVVRLDYRAEQLGRDHNREALERFRDCSESGLWPGYRADETKHVTLTLPGFAFLEEVEDQV
jgi:hypothetical protein